MSAPDPTPTAGTPRLLERPPTQNEIRLDRLQRAIDSHLAAMVYCPNCDQRRSGSKADHSLCSHCKRPFRAAAPAPEEGINDIGSGPDGERKPKKRCACLQSVSSLECADTRYGIEREFGSLIGDEERCECPCHEDNYDDDAY